MIDVDVAILGAGLAGRLCAYQLSRLGLRLALLERGGADGTGSAAYVATAMLAPLSESAMAERTVVAMGLASLPLWHALILALPKPIFWQQKGTLIVWQAADRSEAARLANQIRNRAANAHDYVTAIDAKGIASLEPCLAGHFSQGLFIDQEGQLDNRALLNTLRSGIEQANGQCFWQIGPVDEASLSSLGITAQLILDCRGLGAKSVWPTLRGIRGEVLRVQAPDVQLNRPVRLLHPHYPIYVAPKPDHIYVIGATELESEDLSPISLRSTLELISAAISLHPAFGEARILEANVQCRPTLISNQPAIYASHRNRPQVRINGLTRHGFLVAPIVTQAACQVVCALLAKDLTALHTLRHTSPWPSLFSGPAFT